MSTATLSNDYQIALPKEMREAMHLHSGQEFELVTSGSAIQLIPKLSGEELKAAITASRQWQRPPCRRSFRPAGKQIQQTLERQF